jgi:ABC-2 type transport system ATP-binding protein
MIHPTSGTSFVCSEQVTYGKHEMRKNVGYLVETPHSYPDLTVREISCVEVSSTSTDYF